MIELGIQVDVYVLTGDAVQDAIRRYELAMERYSFPQTIILGSKE